jgi:uncharacterized membrane protein
MSFVESARNAVRSATDEATHRAKTLLAEHGSSEEPAGPVTLTVAADPAIVRALWRDQARLSQVLGDVASVEFSSASSATFTVAAAQGDVVVSTEIVEDDLRLRFVDSRGEGNPEVMVIEVADAPNELGTEVTLELALPLPDIAARTAAFRLLYRARSLLQTGEIPALAPMPAARPGNR